MPLIMPTAPLLSSSPEHLRFVAPGQSPATIEQRSSPDSDHSRRLRQVSRNDRGVKRLTRVSKNQVTRTVQRKHNTPSWGWNRDTEDGRWLAADPNIVLPTDAGRSKPRLERQEAFREQKSRLYFSDVVEDDSDLYRMGLLYDDDHLRDYGFNLDTIVHSEPIYSVRPAKRAKKQRQDPSYLHLELSFSSLGSDRDIQQFLNPDVVELPAPTNDKPKASVVPARSYRDAALSTIHEVPESSTLSLDLPTPEATDLPDLSSDSDGEEDEEEKKDDSHDWALLGDADVLSTADTDADIDAGGVVDSSSATGEAWIVLGDGS